VSLPQVRLYHAILANESIMTLAVELEALARMVFALLIRDHTSILLIQILRVDTVQHGKIGRDRHKGLILAYLLI